MSEVNYHLTHANLARARAPLDDPLMKEFVDHLDEIDALAQSWPGFVAQPTLPDEGEVYREPFLLNVSIWESVDSLREFTYTSRHSELSDRRVEWFVQLGRPSYVLYWSTVGLLPSEREIRRRLEHLEQHGPTPLAFTFERPFTVQEMLDYSPQ
jgi:hypothetical protein